METIMLVLFGLGIVFALLTAFAGDLFGLEASVGDIPYLSPTVIATFLTVTGGAGYLLHANTAWSSLAVTGVSLVGSLGVSAAMLFLVVIPLNRAQKGDARSAKEMIGRTAEVVIPIEARRFGEIVYELGGTRHSAPAKSRSEQPILQGTQVRIIGESAGTFIVEVREPALSGRLWD